MIHDAEVEVKDFVNVLPWEEHNDPKYDSRAPATRTHTAAKTSLLEGKGSISHRLGAWRVSIAPSMANYKVHLGFFWGVLRNCTLENEPNRTNRLCTSKCPSPRAMTYRDVDVT